MVDPAIFDATHVYSPTCLAFTLSMVNCLVRFPVAVTTTSCNVGSIVSLLNIHVISKGKSPLEAVQVKDAVSPALSGSSPKEKDAIWGATVEKCRWFILFFFF